MKMTDRVRRPIAAAVALTLCCCAGTFAQDGPGGSGMPAGFAPPIRDPQSWPAADPAAAPRTLPPYPVLPLTVQPETARDLNRWTILFYDDAEFQGYDPLDHFAADAASGDGLDVVLLRDTMTTAAQIWYLPGHGERLLLEEPGEVDMGDPATLRDFIRYGKEHFPAERYLLCIYDHGSGFAGACVDRSCVPETFLSMRDQQLALADAGGVDILAYTAPCLMGALESAYELRDQVQVYVGSEDLNGYGQWHGIFAEFCGRLANSDGVATEELAATMIDLLEANDTLPSDRWTMSAIAGAGMVPLVAALDELATRLAVGIETFGDALSAARAEAWVIGAAYGDSYDMVDLVSLMERIAAASDAPEVQHLAARVIELHDAALVAEMHGPEQIGEHGMSVYFPRYEFEYEPLYDSVALDFKDRSHWDELLDAYYSGVPMAVEARALHGVRGMFR